MEEKIPGSILKKIQECINDIPVIVLGSGSSAAYGMPGMPKLAEYLVKEIKPSCEDKDIWEKFIEQMNNGIDIETALHNVIVTPKIEKEIVKKTYELILSKDIEIFSTIVKSNNTMPLTKLLQCLIRTANPKIKIVTTNYDRLAEYAIDQCNVGCTTGFNGNYYKTFSNYNFRKSNGNTLVELLKVHGSVDWFLDDTSIAISLPDNCEESNRLSPLMITPGFKKYEITHNDPFRSIISRMDEVFENSTAILCVGYGFNDNHIQTKLLSKIQKSCTPTLIISRTLTDNAKNCIYNCKQNNTIGIEKNGEGSRIMCSNEGEFLVDGDYWSLEGLLKLII